MNKATWTVRVYNEKSYEEFVEDYDVTGEDGGVHAEVAIEFGDYILVYVTPEYEEAVTPYTDLLKEAGATIAVIVDEEAGDVDPEDLDPDAVEEYFASLSKAEALTAVLDAFKEKYQAFFDRVDALADTVAGVTDEVAARKRE